MSGIENVLPNIVGFSDWTFHLVFYRIPKNASTSIFNHLGDFNLIKKHEQVFRNNCDPKLYKNFFDPTHAKPDEVYSIFRHEIANYKSFCVVRNPWDRAVSMFKFCEKEDLMSKVYGIEGEITFKRFCHILKEEEANKYFLATNKQVEWTKGFYPPNKILRFESLSKDFSEMLKELNVSHVSSDLPHTNATNHTHYSDYYDSETKKIVSEVFEEDIDRFKYTFNSVNEDCLEPKVSRSSLRI